MNLKSQGTVLTLYALDNRDMWPQPYVDLANQNTPNKRSSRAFSSLSGDCVKLILPYIFPQLDDDYWSAKWKYTSQQKHFDTLFMCPHADNVEDANLSIDDVMALRTASSWGGAQDSSLVLWPFHSGPAGGGMGTWTRRLTKYGSSNLPYNFFFNFTHDSSNYELRENRAVGDTFRVDGHYTYTHSLGNSAARSMNYNVLAGDILDQRRDGGNAGVVTTNHPPLEAPDHAITPGQVTYQNRGWLINRNVTPFLKSNANYLIEDGSVKHIMDIPYLLRYNQGGDSQDFIAVTPWQTIIPMEFGK